MRLGYMMPLGLGLAALGRPGYINLGHAADLEGDYDTAGMERRCHAVLDAAWAAGIRWFDTARSYGQAEKFLASWLRSRGVAPGAAMISSKWGYTYTAGWQVTAERHEVKDHSLAALTRQLAESRSLLGAHLRLYQVHSATLDSGILEDEEVLGRLGELRDKSLPVGLTLSGPRQRETLERALEIRVSGRPLWSVVQATWNLLERSVEPALIAAKRQGLRVVIKEALANGRLTSRSTDPRLAPLTGYAQRLGASVDAVALAAALARPFTDLVLSGATTPAQFAENVRATEIDGAGIARDLAGLVEPPETYWSERARLPWN
jgi:aryl-alcohol dehydrogenase-like predicted oxidoreductase